MAQENLLEKTQLPLNENLLAEKAFDITDIVSGYKLPPPSKEKAAEVNLPHPKTIQALIEQGLPLFDYPASFPGKQRLPLSRLDVGLLPEDTIEEQIFKRGKNQSNWERVGKALPRFLLGALAKTGEGTAMVAGALPALVMQDMSLMTNNTFVKAFEEMDEAQKEALPIWHTLKYMDPQNYSEVLDKIFSVEYLADDGMDQLAFVASLFTPGAILKGAGVGVKAAQSLRNFNKVLTSAKAGKVSTKVTPQLKSLSDKIDLANMSAYSVLAESGIESRDTETSLRDYYEQNNIPITPEIEAKIAKARKETFSVNIPVLAVSNTLQALLLTRGFSRISRDISRLSKKGTDAIKDVSVKDYFKTIGMNVGVGMVSQGPLEEGPQFAVQDYELEYAKGSVSIDLMQGLFDSYLKAYTDVTGQEALTVGSLMGGLFGVIGGVQGTKTDRENLQRQQRAMNFAVDLFSDKVNNIYKKDEKGNIIQEDGVPVVDAEKLNQVQRKFFSELYLANQVIFAVKNGDRIKADFLRDLKFSNMAIDFFQEEGGLEYLNDKIDAYLEESKKDEDAEPEIDEEGNIVLVEQQKAEYKKRAKELYNIYTNIVQNEGGIMDLGKEDPSFRENLILQQFYEGVKQSFIESKLSGVRSRISNVESKLEYESPAIREINNLVEEYYAQSELIKKLEGEKFKKFQSKEFHEERAKNIDKEKFKRDKLKLSIKRLKQRNLEHL